MIPPSWPAVVERPREGLKQLLTPLASSKAGSAAVDLLASRALRATIKPVRLAPLNVEHAEQLASSHADEVEALVVEIQALNQTRELWVGETFHRFGPISFGSATDCSVWELDEWKFESADSDVVDALVECGCDLELNEWQWVVSNDEQQRYLATNRLHDDFSSANEGDLEFDVLDATLPLSDLFLRATAGLLVPVAGKKVLFHPEVVITQERAWVRTDEAS